MKANPRYRSPNTHSLEPHQHNTQMQYHAPNAFCMAEAHGTLIYGGFGPEPTRITRVRNDAPIPNHQKARMMNAAYYMPKPNYRKVDVNLSPFDEGAIAAMGGKGTRACPYDALENPSEFDEWMDGFNCN